MKRKRSTIENAIIAGIIACAILLMLLLSHTSKALEEAGGATKLIKDTVTFFKTPASEEE